MELNGRQIDISCPWSNDCYADGGCSYTCPETLRDVLVKTALLEHECELLPHNDPDIEDMCPTCVDIPPFKPDMSLIKPELKGR